MSSDPTIYKYYFKLFGFFIRKASVGPKSFLEIGRLSKEWTHIYYSK